MPVSDYEVVEVKENRVVLKSAQFDRTIKIGGGKETPSRREDPEEEEGSEETQAEGGKKERGRRRRRRRAGDERDDLKTRLHLDTPSVDHASTPAGVPAAPLPPMPHIIPPPPFTPLIPPPTTLISDTIKKQKKELELVAGEGSAEVVAEAEPLSHVATPPAGGAFPSWMSFLS